MPELPAPKPPGTVAQVGSFSTVGIGAFLTILMYGFQAAQANHPDAISALGPYCDVGAITGILGIVGGLFWHGLNTVKSSNALQAEKTNAVVAVESEKVKSAAVIESERAKTAIAEISPAIDPVTKLPSAGLALTHALQLAADEEDWDLVDELSAVQKKRKAAPK